MSKFPAIKNFFYSERWVVGLIAALGLAFLLELTGVYLLMLLAGGIAGFFVKKGWLSFIIGFVGVALAWGIYFIYFAFLGPLGEFFQLIGSIIGISGAILMIISLIMGGLMGGIGALVGAYSTQLILGEKYIKKSQKNK
ncbi:MAG: hypothetical protein HWN65_06490 [Candidatus Helarchaeota archaeon]|nr:hypothetical protein [Candidatus Helarchaeota archaeon]